MSAIQEAEGKVFRNRTHIHTKTPKLWLIKGEQVSGVVYTLSDRAITAALNHRLLLNTQSAASFDTLSRATFVVKNFEQWVNKQALIRQ